MTPFAPIAAIDADVIRIIVIVVIFVIAGLSQLVTKLKQIQPPQQGGAPRPPKPVPADVADEIEEFMRRAAQRRNPKGPREAPAQLQPAAPKPVRAEAVVKARRPVGESIKDHVKEYLDEAEEFARREDKLGKEVAEADRAIDQRLHMTFDHQVSQLHDVPGEAAAAEAGVEPQSLVVSGLFDLLADPASLRQAIILNEVLRRPEERWA